MKCMLYLICYSNFLIHSIKADEKIWNDLGVLRSKIALNTRLSYAQKVRRQEISKPIQCRLLKRCVQIY